MIVILDVPKKSDSRYQRLKKHKLFFKRAGIEPTMGHLKSDYRLGYNFYKGVMEDTVNVLLASAADNFKRAMKAFGYMLQKSARYCVKVISRRNGLSRHYEILVIYLQSCRQFFGVKN